MKDMTVSPTLTCEPHLAVCESQPRQPSPALVRVQAPAPTSDRLQMVARKGQATQLSFGERHPVLRGIGLTYLGGVAGGAVGLAGGIAYGKFIRATVQETQRRFVTGAITGGFAGALTIGTIGMAAGALYGVYRGVKGS